MNTKLKNTTIEIVLILGFVAVESLSKEQHVLLKVKVEKFEGRFLVELNCTISQTSALHAAVFLLNNKSLENIHSSNGSCFINLRKCQQQECECGLLYFTYNTTLQFRKQQNIFTCVVRFDEKQNIQVEYQHSVLHNSSGIYSLNETKEVKGQPSPDKEPDTPKEQDDNEQLIIVVSVVIVVISIVVTVFIIRKTNCLKEKTQRRTSISNRNGHDTTVDSIDHTEMKNIAVVQIEQTREQNSILTTSPDEREEYHTTANDPRPKKVNDKTASTEERTQLIAHTSIDISRLPEENKNREVKLNSKTNSSIDVNQLGAEFETVPLAIERALTTVINPLDDENKNVINPLDDENKNLDGRKESDDGEEEKFYPPELEIDSM